MKQTLPIGNLLLGILYSSIAAVILTAAMLAVSSAKPHQSMVLLGGEEIVVVKADTPALHEQGLSGREKLGHNEGMLFVFTEPQPYGFWMKDMHFSIDIIWFDENHRIVDVWENATPQSYPKVFTPRTSAQFVIEVPAGFFSGHNLKIGNTFEILR